MNVTNEMFAEWKSHPVTKEIFLQLVGVRNDLTEQLASGQTIKILAEDTHGMTNRIVGQIDGINQVLNISFED
jgi:hypothetical protein